MAFRRIARIRRRRPYRRRAIFRRRRRRVRRNKSGTLFVKLTKISTVQVPNSATTSWGVNFHPTDFDEFNRLAPEFEYSKWHKIKCRVIPMQNVSNSSTSLVPSYIMAPWHNDYTTQKAFNIYASIDRAKIYRQTDIGRMNFVPNTLIGGSKEGTELQSGKHQLYNWRPIITRMSTNSSQDYPRIYGGVIAFQGESDLEGRTATFNVVMDVWVSFHNQNTLIY